MNEATRDYVDRLSSLPRLMAEYDRVAALQRELVAEIGRMIAALERQSLVGSPGTLDRPQFATVEEAVRVLGFQPGESGYAGSKRVYLMISRGQLNAVKLGRSVRVPFAELRRLAAEGPGEPDFPRGTA